MEKCTKHPKFNGKKKPSYQCGKCLGLYLQLKGRRIPVPKPGYSFKTIKDYSRKNKHKKPLI